MGIVRMILGTSKGGIGRWKIAEVGQLIFGKYCRDGCIYKCGCENERTPTTL